MTETPAAEAAPPPVHPLVRRDDDKVLAGVCAAFGRYTGTDPVLWRVVLGVLVFFGGAGLAVYLAGWLLIPKPGEGSIADRALGTRSGRGLTPVTAVVVGLAVVALAALVDDGRGVAALAVVALVGYLVVRERSTAPAGPLPAGPAGPAGPLPAGPLPAPPGTPAWGAVPTPSYAGPAVPPPPASRVGPVTLALTLLVGGALSALRLAGVEELTAPRVLAACLVVTALGLLVGSVVGRARWLFFFPGLVLAVALAGTAAVDGVVDGGVGDRTWVVAGGAPTRTFELGIGEATLDLRGADTSGRVLDITARVGVGHLVVVVPDDLTVRIRSRVGLGEIDDGGTESRDGSGLEQETVIGEGDVEAELDLRVGTGQVEVRRG